MAIATDDTVLKFGTQDTASSSQTTIADDAFQACGLVWANTDNAPYASFVLKAQHDAGNPTGGSIDLYAQPMNLDGTDDANVPDASYLQIYIGSFGVDQAAGAETDYSLTLKNGIAALPQLGNDQDLTFHLHNNNTGRVLGTGWTLKVTPVTEGPL